MVTFTELEGQQISGSTAVLTNMYVKQSIEHREKTYKRRVKILQDTVHLKETSEIQTYELEKRDMLGHI